MPCCCPEKQVQLLGILLAQRLLAAIDKILQKLCILRRQAAVLQQQLCHVLEGCHRLLVVGKLGLGLLCLLDRIFHYTCLLSIAVPAENLPKKGIIFQFSDSALGMGKGLPSALRTAPLPDKLRKTLGILCLGERLDHRAAWVLRLCHLGSIPGLLARKWIRR